MTVQERTNCAQRCFYGAYVYNIVDDRVHDASEKFREWKSSKRVDKDTIAPNRFNVGYDKGSKEWLKKDIQNVFSQNPCTFDSVTDKESKAVAELQEVNKEAQEVYAMFFQNLDTFEKANQEVEILRRGYEDFDI